jgi:MFS family permease
MTDLQQAAAPLTGTAAGRPAPARAVTVLLTAVAYFMVALDALVVVTALPSVHRDLGGSIGTLQWTVNIYSLAFGAGIITAAALGDRLGRRRVYVTGLVVFTLASAACALAPSAPVLIACRGVQGLGAAIIMPLGLTLLTSAFPPERRGTVVGIWGGIAGLAVASGPLIGGAVTQGLDWHWIFWVNVPIGLAAAVGVARPEDPARRARPGPGLGRDRRADLGPGARHRGGLCHPRHAGRAARRGRPDRRPDRVGADHPGADDPAGIAA